MEKDLVYAVVGCGAIGGFYGAKLANSGKAVNFLLHSDYDYVKLHGLTVESVDGDIILEHPAVYNDATTMPSADVVLVCLKTTANHQLPELLRPILKPDSTVIMIKNGLGMERDLQPIFPGVGIIGAMAFICSNKVGKGHIRHLDYGALTMGIHCNVDTARMDAITHDFRASSVAITIAPDLNTARWRKLVWNIPYNGLSVVLNSETDRLMAVEETRSLIRSLMIEVIEAAKACGAEISTSFADEMMEATQKMKPYRPSMMLDFLNHRKMEISRMYLSPVAEAKKHGFEMKRTMTVAQMLAFIEANY